MWVTTTKNIWYPSLSWSLAKLARPLPNVSSVAPLWLTQFLTFCLLRDGFRSGLTLHPRDERYQGSRGRGRGPREMGTMVWDYPCRACSLSFVRQAHDRFPHPTHHQQNPSIGSPKIFEAPRSKKRENRLNKAEIVRVNRWYATLMQN